MSRDPALLTRRLGAFEEAMILTQEYSPFNVVIALRLENAPGIEALRKALDQVQRRQPALRAAVAGRTGCRRFVVSTGELPMLAERVESLDAHGLAAVDEELARPLPLAQGPLAHARYRLDGSGRAELLLTFAHAIVDAASGVRLVDALLTLASNATPNVAPTPDDEAPLAPLPRLEERFPPRFRGGRGRWRSGLGLIRSLSSELAFHARTRGAGLPSITPKARSRALAVELDPGATAAAVRRARREQVTLNSALCAAFLLAARAKLRAGRRLPARLFTMADLRSYVDPPLASDALGAGWAMMRFVVEPASDDVWTFAKTLNGRLQRELRGGARWLAYLTILPMMRLGLGGRRFRMGEMAVSHIGPAPIAARYGPVRVEGLQVFVSNLDLGPEYIVQSRLRDGRLSWGIVYLDGDMERARAQEVADEAARLLVETG